MTPLLERAGYRCLPVDLSAPPLGPTLGGFAETVIDALADAADEPVVLVAHSISGLLLPLVAARRPVRGLVYLAAAVPKPGKSFLDRVREEPDMFHPRWVALSPRWADAAERPALAAEFLFHDCAEERLRSVEPTVTMLDVSSLVRETWPLESARGAPSSYIVCSHDRTLNPAWCRRVAREELGIEPVEIPAGHAPHVCQPGLLAQVLISEVRRLTSPPDVPPIGLRTVNV